MRSKNYITTAVFGDRFISSILPFVGFLGKSHEGRSIEGLEVSRRAQADVRLGLNTR